MMKASLSIRSPSGTLVVAIERQDDGRPILLLHGGAGPASMSTLIPLLTEFGLIVPTHPGFDATLRPAWFTSITDLALCYLRLLETLALHEVIVVGNSIGGWIAAEMAAMQSERVAGIILMNAVGIEPSRDTGPIIDPRAMPAHALSQLSFATPAKAYPVDPANAHLRQANQAVLMDYAGDPFMHDRTLAERLNRITLPTLVLWGRQDRIVTCAYGEKYARQIPGAEFQVIEDAGHLPQVEQPVFTAQAIRSFAAGLA